MKPTKPWVLVVTTAVSVALAYTVLRLWDHFGDSIPPVPLSAPITLAVLAVAVLGVALGLRSRLNAYREARARIANGEPRDPRERPVKPVDPLQAARALVLAKASGLVGAVFGGIYGGYGLFLLGKLDIAADRAQALRCLLAFIAGVALVAAALFLERILKVPPEQPAERNVASGGVNPLRGTGAGHG
ncbi:MAG TPA: DUF3180 domain-containing protein [Thermoleophilia bacterium]|nr:DUF3180 domain-containing protein [Thermoleophilia bacterium]